MRIIEQLVDTNVLRKIGWQLRRPATIWEKLYRGKKHIYMVRLRVIKSVLCGVDIYSDGKLLVSQMPPYLHKLFVRDMEDAIKKR